ncbi:hypothetical protein [Xenorhabdus eapokensis]|uniref:Uncharacterized protein n=1 Tax=Xenorhabdus eapokensis TaxID=1873482 RepID=A0A1Q5TQX1_9GAMM|nr:hypothetical protein [Xenorhabdus eapokensis]OKP02623.1 hypothetical protein Xedl_02274 [Xenorhabdus eapokensis]
MLIIAVNETSNATPNTPFYDDTQTIPRTDGQYVMTITNGRVLSCESVGEKTLVDAEAYWRLRKDLHAVEKIIVELRNRMRFIHDEHSIAGHDYPVHEVLTR